MSLKINKLTCTFRDSKNESKFLEYIWQNNYIPLYNKYIPFITIPLSIFGIISSYFNEVRFPNAWFYFYIIVGLSFNYLKSNVKKYLIIFFAYLNGFFYSFAILWDNPIKFPFDFQIIIFLIPIIILAFPNISFLPALIISFANFLICMNLLISNNSHFWNIYIPVYIFLNLVFIKWNNEYSNRENFYKIKKL